MPGTQSSAMTPQPPGKDSACRAGNGFQISKTRKRIKPRSKYFQLRAERDVTKPIGRARHGDSEAKALHQMGSPQPISSVRCCPDTSSITTRCGSSSLQYLEA